MRPLDEMADPAGVLFLIVFALAVYGLAFAISSSWPVRAVVGWLGRQRQREDLSRRLRAEIETRQDLGRPRVGREQMAVRRSLSDEEVAARRRQLDEIDAVRRPLWLKMLMASLIQRAVGCLNGFCVAFWSSLALLLVCGRGLGVADFVIYGFGYGALTSWIVGRIGRQSAAATQRGPRQAGGCGG